VLLTQAESLGHISEEQATGAEQMAAGIEKVTDLAGSLSELAHK